MEVLSLSTMLEEIDSEECLSVEGRGQRSGIVSGVVAGVIIAGFLVFFYCPACDTIFEIAEVTGYEGDTSTATCPDCGGALDPIYDDENTGC